MASFSAVAGNRAHDTLRWRSMLNRLVSDPRLSKAQRSFVVDDGVEIEGELRFAGFVRVDGMVTGRLEAARVLVASGGEVHGVLVADEVTIEGLSTAEVYADRIVLRPGSTVTGEIYHADLTVEPLAHFEGKSRRYKDPQLLAPSKIEIVDEEPDAPAHRISWVLERVA